MQIGRTRRYAVVSYLLDTNVVSERTSVRPNPSVIEWVTAQDRSKLFISAATLGELRYGVEKLAAGAKRRRMAAFLSTVEEGTRGQILDIDSKVALEWGRLKRRAEASHRAMPAMDLLLAATAEVHSLTLVTRNASDFEGWGGPMFNPWPQPS